jgi:hypothetical protein
MSSTTRSIHRRATAIEVPAALTLATVLALAATRPVVLFLAGLGLAVAALAVGAAWLADVLYRRLSPGVAVAVGAVLVAAVVVAVRLRAVDWGRWARVSPVSMPSPGWVGITVAAGVVFAVGVGVVASNRAVQRG